MPTPARQALRQLIAGNARFVANESVHESLNSEAKREELTRGQEPMAVILGCSDSRVPAELVFDQTLGDLFVIRVAGNVAAECELGSVEFAATKLGTRLVVVLGHTSCGAILATLDEIRNPSPVLSPNLAAIVDRVRPSIDTSPEAMANLSDTISQATKNNVMSTVKDLYQESEVLRSLIDSDNLLIVGAEYSLSTGVVTFFDD